MNAALRTWLWILFGFTFFFVSLYTGGLFVYSVLCPLVVVWLSYVDYKRLPEHSAGRVHSNALYFQKLLLIFLKIWYILYYH